MMRVEYIMHGFIKKDVYQRYGKGKTVIHQLWYVKLQLKYTIKSFISHRKTS